MKSKSIPKLRIMLNQNKILLYAFKRLVCVAIACILDSFPLLWSHLLYLRPRKQNTNHFPRESNFGR